MPNVAGIASGRILLVCLLLLMLVGCKVELHRALSETEANQMLALLLVSGLQADKRADTTGMTVRIERSDFVRGVEVLRQHGLPHQKRASVEDVFPPGQLVSSPVQEQAKLVFLKEQRLERMLAALDGVMVAEVSIAQVPTDSAGRATLPPGVAVFVKYSPEINMTQRMTCLSQCFHQLVETMGSAVRHAPSMRQRECVECIRRSAPTGIGNERATDDQRAVRGLVDMCIDETMKPQQRAHRLYGRRGASRGGGAHFAG
ncbi:type III secretion inner membrane ring lipoprotein SctJ [Pandoraea sputorum]|uniref:type III secretion system inner membrane ring lipoprotein SctJ n=1 Tax=Pandoraea sputorum TaxID=93222 RepID=UPI001E328909|nr:type III secretion inner membrane ring lipoprotein SctJ [Pandoraea sputorum]MCE4062439.1 type III secretion inner membrane ring lipoprotein SctJ [Pandoraea sputorum]